MMRMNGRWLAELVLLAAVLGMAGGCACKAGARGVTVTLDDSLKDAQGRMMSVEVHLIGVNEADLPAWKNVKLSQYWNNANDPMRAMPDKREMKLSGSKTSDTLAETDPLWQKWLDKGATRLVVMAFLPIGDQDAPGISEKRRMILPLCTRCWDTPEIKLQVQKDGLTLATPYNKHTAECKLSR